MSHLLRTPFLILLGLLLGLPALPARADEDDPPAERLTDRLDELRRDEQWAELEPAVREAPAVYRETEDRRDAKGLRDAVGDVINEDDAPDAVRIAALDALLAFAEPKDAWKEIRREMPDEDIEEATEFHLAIVRAAGQLAQTRAIDPLQDLADSAKDVRLAREAILALGHYGQDRRYRTRILEELMSIALRTRPGISLDKQVSPVARERWQELSPAFIEAMNTLTNQRVASFEDWEILFKDNKRNLRELFLER